MRIGMVSHDAATLLRECPGPEPGGICPLRDRETGRLPCAGECLLLKLAVVGKPSAWVVRVADDTEACPVAVLGP